MIDEQRNERVHCAQTVKKVRNRQNRFTIQWIFALWILFAKVEDSKLYGLKTSLLRKDFDLLRNSRPTVPMYADGRELLVFRTFYSLAACRKGFSTRCNPAGEASPAGFVMRKNDAFSEIGTLRRGRCPHRPAVQALVTPK